MPPEQALGEELDARSDIFSFGVTIYEMATGTLPFKGPTWVAAINEILNKPPLSASLINSEIPPELDRVIGKALEKDRAVRYQTVSDLGIDLKRIRQGCSPGLLRTLRAWVWRITGRRSSQRPSWSRCRFWPACSSDRGDQSQQYVTEA